MGFLLYTLLIILRAETITTMSTQPPSFPNPNGVVIHVTITQSYGTGIAGENYSLECSVSVTGSTDWVLITWLDDAGTSEISSTTVTTGIVSAGSNSSTLTNPLATSHAGTYTCRATLGSAEDTASKNVTVQSTCSKTLCDVNFLALLLLCLCIRHS